MAVVGHTAVMSLQGLVDAASTALGGARDMYGPAATASGLPSTVGLRSLKTTLAVANGSVPATWQGSGGGGYQLSGGRLVSELDAVVGADGRVGPHVVNAGSDSRAGRSGMTNVVSDTRMGVNAIAPSTDTPAGKQAMVGHLEGQLARAKALLTRSEQRNIALANMIRAAGRGYSGAMGAMPIGGGSTGGGVMGGGSPLNTLTGGLGRLLTPLTRLATQSPLETQTSHGGKAVPPLPGLDRPGLANESRIQKYTRRISRAITGAFPEIAEIGGYRPDSLKWHPSGLALDVMIPAWNTPGGKALGDRIVAFVQAHAGELGLDHAIWRQAQHNPDGSTVPMSVRPGGATQNHFDHVHIASIGGGFAGH